MGKAHQPVKLKFDNAAPTTVDSITRSSFSDVQEIGEKDNDRLMPTGQKITSRFLLTDNIQLGDINVKK
jgi:hypothetical protein